MSTQIPMLNQDLLILLAMILASLISVAGVGRCKTMPERIAVATSFGSFIVIGTNWLSSQLACYLLLSITQSIWAQATKIYFTGDALNRIVV